MRMLLYKIQILYLSLKNLYAIDQISLDPSAGRKLIFRDQLPFILSPDFTVLAHLLATAACSTDELLVLLKTGALAVRGWQGLLLLVVGVAALLAGVCGLNRWLAQGDSIGAMTSGLRHKIYVASGQVWVPP
jgi:hypothetical protein